MACALLGSDTEQIPADAFSESSGAVSVSMSIGENDNGRTLQRARDSPSGLGFLGVLLQGDVGPYLVRNGPWG